MHNTDLGRFHLRLKAASRRLISGSDRLQSLQRLTAVLDRDHAELGDTNAEPFEDENESAQHRTERSIHINAGFSCGPAHLIEKRRKFCLRGAHPAGCLLQGWRCSRFFSLSHGTLLPKRQANHDPTVAKLCSMARSHMVMS